MTDIKNIKPKKCLVEIVNFSFPKNSASSSKEETELYDSFYNEGYRRLYEENPATSTRHNDYIMYRILKTVQSNLVNKALTWLIAKL